MSKLVSGNWSLEITSTYYYSAADGFIKAIHALCLCLSAH